MILAPAVDAPAGRGVVKIRRRRSGTAQTETLLYKGGMSL